MILNNIFNTFELMYQQLVNEYIAIRKRKKISQTVAAERSGVSYSTISRMETGECMPQLDNFTKMAKGIGMMVAIVPLPVQLAFVEEPKVVVEEPKVVDYDDWDYDNEEVL